MPSPAVLPSEIEQALARGWVVLTANQRAARTLRHAFDQRQRELGSTIWSPPSILAWATWTSSLWKRLLLEGHASDLLLSSTQEHINWHAIIAADTATASLRPIDALAETAANAWKLLHDYSGRPRLTSFPGNSDTRAFARWVAEFERRCTHSRYLTEARLAETLRAAIDTNHLTFADGLLLVGFDTKTPAQTALIEAVRSTGAEIAELEQAAPAPNLTLTSAPDEHSELTACANWLRVRLTEQPDSTIAVIVPNIDADRAEIDRAFRQILAPELNDIAAPTASGPYEFSLGISLARTPLAATALDILRWANGSLPLDRVCGLLLSPHFAADDAEHLARAEFDAFTLRDQSLLQPQVSIDALYRIAAGSKRSSDLPTLLSHLRSLRTQVTRLDLAAKRTHADWATTIHELLEAANWAPTSQLDSIEFQTRRKWDSALDELATLDFDGTRVSFPTALAALERIAAETLFAPESRHAPIQIMGPLESAGSAFDTIWFLRANDAAWPATPAPNPLLPWLLQRELAMPGVDPTRDSAHGRLVTERIAASASTVIFSYARESAEGRQRSSPGLAGLTLENRPIADLVPEVLATEPIKLDAFTDKASIPPPPDRGLRGGAGILQSQAACGFRAFAEKRLFASAPDTPSLGLDPAERGSLVHSILERFWAVVETQSALKHMPTSERDALLAHSIDDTLAKHNSHRESGWPTAYLAAERERLLNLLRPWLDYEANERAPFTVLSREENLPDVHIGPLQLNIRVDRVDRIHAAGSSEPADDLGEMIIDYKTGAAAPRDWLGPRPDQPQLPLYAVVADKPDLAAIVFASIRPGNLMGMAGYESPQSDILLKPAKMNAASLAAQVDEWRDILTSLAEDFHAGNASVSPKHYPQTCQYCEQRLLCRLNPSSLDPDALEEIEEDETSEESDFV